MTEINRIFGNLNPLLNGGKKVESEDTKSASKKKDVPVGQPKSSENTKEITLKDLSNNPTSLYAAAGLSLGNVNTSEKATAERALAFFKLDPEMINLKREFGLPAEIDGLDEDFAAQLDPKTLAYIAKIPANRADKIGQGAVADYEKLTELAS